MGHSDLALTVVTFGASVAVLTFGAAGRLSAVFSEGWPSGGPHLPRVQAGIGDRSDDRDPTGQAGRPAYAAAIIAIADREPAPLRVILGSEALVNTLKVLKERVAGLEAQTELAASTDFPPGE